MLLRTETPRRHYDHVFERWCSISGIQICFFFNNNTTAGPRVSVWFGHGESRDGEESKAMGNPRGIPTRWASSRERQMQRENVFLKMKERERKERNGAPRRLARLDSRTVRAFSSGKDERNDLLPLVRAPGQPVSQSPCFSRRSLTRAPATSRPRICGLCAKAARDNPGLPKRHCPLSPLHLALQTAHGSRRPGRQRVPYCRGRIDDGQQVFGRQHVHEQDLGRGLWHPARRRQPHRGRVSPRHRPQSLRRQCHLCRLASTPQGSRYCQGEWPCSPRSPASKAGPLRSSPAIAPPWSSAAFLLSGDALHPPAATTAATTAAAAIHRSHPLHPRLVQSLPVTRSLLP